MKNKQQIIDIQAFQAELVYKQNENSVSAFLCADLNPLAKHISIFVVNCPHVFIGIIDVINYLRDDPMAQASGEKPPTTQEVIGAMAELGFVKIPDSLSFGDGNGQPLHIWVASQWNKLEDIIDLLLEKSPDSIDAGIISSASEACFPSCSMMSVSLYEQHPVGSLDH